MKPTPTPLWVQAVPVARLVARVVYVFVIAPGVVLFACLLLGWMGCLPSC